MNNKPDDYSDMLYLPQHTSLSHPRMSRIDRAAQFSPFAALVGYDAAVEETARETEGEIYLDEDRKEELNMRLQVLLSHISEHPQASITYFLPDSRKAGGSYPTVTGAVKRIDLATRMIFLVNGTLIPIDNIVEVTFPEQ